MSEAEPAAAADTVNTDPRAAEVGAPPDAPPAIASGPDVGVTKPADDVFSAMAQSRSALARGLASIGDEVVSFARCSFDAGTQAAIEMLGVKTWADAVAVNTGLVRTSLDHWLDSTAKVSELSFKLALDCSQPLANRLGTVWSVADRAG